MSNLINKIVAKFNNEDVIKFSDKDGFAEIKSWAHTGSPELDSNLRTFGLPTGIIEIAGPSRSGKTTIGLMAMKNFMKENPETGVVVILSSENRDNKDYALQMALKIEDIIIMRVRYVEKMFMMVKKLIDDTEALFKEERLGKPKYFFLWDSLGATLSKAELDTMEENTKIMDAKFKKGEDIDDLKNEKMMAFAKSAKMFAKFLTGEMYTKTIHFVMLNHQYDSTKPGSFVAKKVSTGGQWVELMCTLRLETTVIASDKIDDIIVAQISKVKVVKSDFGSYETSAIRILLGYGIILSDGDIEYAVEQGILVKAGAKKISFMGDKLKWSSPRELYQNYYDHNKFIKVLHTKIKSSRDRDLIALREKLMNK